MEGDRIFDLPFPHVVIDNAFDTAEVVAAASAWPATDWPHWTVRYDNPLECKLACNDWAKMPVPCRALLNRLLGMRLYDWAAPSEQLYPDGGLWGGGMHAFTRGGFLDLHEDSDTHPVLGWRRRFNAILYINPLWDDDWGGSYEMWDQHGQHCVKRVQPRFNRLLVFEVGDGHFHGVPEPVACPEGLQRMTLAVFWYDTPAGWKGKRPRARFVARPGDPPDPAKDALRSARATFSG